MLTSTVLFWRKVRYSRFCWTVENQQFVLMEDSSEGDRSHACAYAHMTQYITRCIMGSLSFFHSLFLFLKNSTYIVQDVSVEQTWCRSVSSSNHCLKRQPSQVYIPRDYICLCVFDQMCGRSFSLFPTRPLININKSFGLTMFHLHADLTLKPWWQPEFEDLFFLSFAVALIHFFTYS